MKAVLATLSSYLPYPLAAQIRREPGHPLRGQEKRFAAVSLFADLAGFTPLAEALGRVGPAGTEELTRLLNGRFTPMIEAVHRWGGLVGKFAGDAMVVLFPVEPGETREETTQRALACTLALQREIRRQAMVETQAGPVELRMKLGLAAGEVLRTVVGADRQQEFVYAGQPLDDAAAAEHRAAPGEVILHGTVRAWWDQEIAGQELGEGYLHLGQPAVEAAPRPRRPLPPVSDVEAAIAALRPFVPEEIYARLAQGQEAFVNEHRWVTVLFAAFAGIDYSAPDAAERLGDYLEQVFDLVERYGGHVRQVEMGDKGSKVIILFGAPVAHEDDEERALLCALALRTLAADVGIAGQRIGVNSGRVFVGNVGSPRRQEYAAIGDAVNLSARLMQRAAQGQVLVGEDTYRAMAGRFDWRALGGVPLKGKAEPVSLYALQGRRRGPALGLQEPRYRLPMVGRQEELRRLAETLAQVERTGEGHVAGLTAEAGMGKSRLAAEVITQALEMGYHGYGGHGVSHGTTTPYLAWRPLLRGLLGVADEGEVADQVGALERRLAAVDPDLLPRLPLLGDILGMQIADNALTATFEAKLRQQSLFALVADLVRHQAGQGPLLLVMEDAHWLDELSRSLVQYLARQVVDLPVLFLVVYRPLEIERGQSLWDERPLENFYELQLGPFSPEESAALIDLKLAGRALPEEIVEQVVERAQGNPFFVDEFVNLLLEEGVDLDSPAALGEVEVPESLERLVVSRLDQLEESEKMTIRVASVIGRLFRARWLLAIYPGEMRERVLRQDLDRLSSLDLVPLDKPDPELEYLFKHAVTQEVAYGTLSFANRRMLHERVGAYIERAYGDGLEGWYGILAYHYGRAGLPEKEFPYVRLAAERAARQSALQQAASFYDRAIELARAHGLATPEERFAMHDGRFSQYEGLGVYERLEGDAEALLALAEELGAGWQARAWHRRGLAHWRQGQPEEAIVWYERAIDLAEARGEGEALLDALIARGYAHFSAGEYDAGKAMLQRVVAEAGEEGWAQEARASQVLGWIVYDEGDYAQCERYWQRSLALRQARGSKPGEALVLSNLGSLYATLNYVQKGIDYAQRGRDLAAQIGYKVGELEGWLRIGEHLLGAGQYERTMDYFRRALDLSNRLAADVWGQSYIRTRMAEALLGMGEDLDRAEALSAEAVEIGEAEGAGKELLGWLYHTRGRVLLRLGDLVDAREALEASAQMRREIKQWFPYAHTLSDLAELHLRQGDLAAAEAVAGDLLGLLFPEEGDGVEGMEEVPAAWACYRVLAASGEEERAGELLEHAYRALQRYAGRLETEELRRSFLERVSPHRAVVETYQEGEEG